MGDRHETEAKARAPRPRPDLYIRFIGGGITLEKVPLSALSQVLEAFGRLATSEPPAARKREKGEPADAGPLQLVSVRPGSALYGCTSRGAGLDRLHSLGSAVARPSEFTGADFSLGAVDEVSGVAKRLRCQVQILAPGPDGKARVVARIGPKTSRDLQAALFIEGETTLFGKVERVGGATKMRCSLRIASQDSLVYCRVRGEELSRKLGGKMYQEVAVSGRATWNRASWRIVRFEIRSMEQPEQGDLVEAFREIRDAGGGDWDLIDDPEAFLGRGEG